jgi:hypothetical protein
MFFENLSVAAFAAQKQKKTDALFLCSASRSGATMRERREAETKAIQDDAQPGGGKSPHVRQPDRRCNAKR